MPTASRTNERRPSAPTSSGARSLSPFASVTVVLAASRSIALTDIGWIMRIDGRAFTAPSSAIRTCRASHISPSGSGSFPLPLEGGGVRGGGELLLFEKEIGDAPDDDESPLPPPPLPLGEGE